MPMSIPIKTRHAQPDDASWILSLVPRLHEFGPPRWRTVEQMNAGEHADLSNALNHLEDEASVLFVAEREADEARLGFLYATTAVDFFTSERHAHVKDVVVAAEGEGQGCGRVLLAAAEEWARTRGHRFITLSVFPGNRRAFDLYERIGYETDVLRMLKLLG
jgi:ribosomal protein S18 acetylase RimI-like enzyme